MSACSAETLATTQAAPAVASRCHGYIGRFAPSPTGPLHAGSLVAALASWLDARAHGGTWLVRVEDGDTPRCIPGVDAEILRQLAACGLLPDAPPARQSQRSALYQAALNLLIAQGAAYPCACSRKDIEAAWLASGTTEQPKPRYGELVYPGTCRHGLHGKSARAWRFLTDFYKPNQPLAQENTAQTATKSIVPSNPQNTPLHWHDRRLGAQQQQVSSEVGDFVLRRADGLWAYQLAVVVDDAAQGITHIVRGADLTDNTARQILLQRALGYATPQYLHTPLVLAADGHKLSKQNGAQPLNVSEPVSILNALNQAAICLGLRPVAAHTPLAQALHHWVTDWSQAWLLQSKP